LKRGKARKHKHLKIKAYCRLVHKTTKEETRLVDVNDMPKRKMRTHPHSQKRDSKQKPRGSPIRPTLGGNRTPKTLNRKREK
jgi:hypothetical protein